MDSMTFAVDSSFILSSCVFLLKVTSPPVQNISFLDFFNLQLFLLFWGIVLLNHLLLWLCVILPLKVR